MRSPTRHKLLLASAAIALAVWFLPSAAEAHYPQISPIQDLRINMNETGPLMHFIVSDNETPADQLVLTYRSSNAILIPNDDDHITLGGGGQDRTITITPVENQSGIANITIIITDADGDQNRESFQVIVTRPPNL